MISTPPRPSGRAIDRHFLPQVGQHTLPRQLTIDRLVGRLGGLQQMPLDQLEQHQADIDGDIEQPRHTAGRGTDHFRTERIVVAFELRSGE